jgi:hypothetical protein
MGTAILIAAYLFFCFFAVLGVKSLHDRDEEISKSAKRRDGGGNV